MIVSIHQPAYLPWLGYFDKILRSDLFIYLDTVQFQKGSFQNRNRIRTKSGPIWLTVPVETKGKLYDLALKDVPVDHRQNWQSKHLASLKMNYGKAPFTADRLAQIEHFYTEPQPYLSAVCFDMMVAFNAMLGITTPVVRASDLGPMDGAKSDLVQALCQSVGAKTYLSGSMGRDYLDEAAFADAGLEIVYQDYQHPVYRQQYSGFEPAMGIVDLLFNEARPTEFFNDER